MLVSAIKSSQIQFLQVYPLQPGQKIVTIGQIFYEVPLDVVNDENSVLGKQIVIENQGHNKHMVLLQATIPFIF